MQQVLRDIKTDGIFECISCDNASDNMRHTWKHHCTQHLYIDTHTCAKLMAVVEAKEEKFLMAMINNKLSGHTCGMPTKSNLHFPAQSALLAVSLQRTGSRNIPGCEELEGGKTEKFGCDTVGCGIC